MPDKNHIIDCDAAPFVPDGWEVEEHIKGGKFEWDAKKVMLYLDESQKDVEDIVGHELLQKLTQQPVLNANVLDYLFAHPNLIPKGWKRWAVFFWGTIYHDSSGVLYVRYLEWDCGKWLWDGQWLECGWNRLNPAAVLASAISSDALSLEKLDERLRAVEDYMAKMKSL